MRPASACLMLLLLISASAEAQLDVAANPTRPSVSDNAFLTAPGHAEVEAGWLGLDGFWTLPTLLKLGLHRRFELGVAVIGLLNHEGGKTEFGDPGVQAKVQYFEGSWGGLAAVGRADWAGESDPGYTAYGTVSLNRPVCSSMRP